MGTVVNIVTTATVELCSGFGPVQTSAGLALFQVGRPILFFSFFKLCMVTDYFKVGNSDFWHKFQFSLNFELKI
jgi:hypothetical protein